MRHSMTCCTAACAIVVAAALAAAGPAIAQSGGKADGAKDAQAQKTAAAKTPQKPAPGKTHKVAIQVAENNPALMNLALNNAKNVADYFAGKGEKVAVEIVAFGPGLHMLRDDTSPVKARIATMSLETPSVTFAACANTQGNMSKAEQKEVGLISEAKVVPSGVVRIMELQGKGYAYLRP